MGEASLFGRQRLRTWARRRANTGCDSAEGEHKPAPRCRPRPGEPLRSMQKGDVTWSAELRYHGEYGVEAQILRNGELVIGRRFVLRRSRRSGPRYILMC